MLLTIQIITGFLFAAACFTGGLILGRISGERERVRMVEQLKGFEGLTVQRGDDGSFTITSEYRR